MGLMNDSVTDYGIADPCQIDRSTFEYPIDAGAPPNPQNMQFRTARDSCGNYFNAPRPGGTSTGV